MPTPPVHKGGDVDTPESSAVAWWWCLHCERVWSRDDLDHDGEFWACGGADCDGFEYDLFDYHKRRREVHPKWPAQVTSGQHVPEWPGAASNEVSHDRRRVRR